MAEIRFNYGDKFTQTTDTNTGIGSTIPATKLDIAGGTSAGSLRVSGIATLSSYQGFVNTKLTPTENLIVEAGNSGSISGEVVIGTGQTISVSTGATTGQGGVHSLKVYETFMPPVGGTADRPTDVKPGMVYYNKDFKTIEFWDGNFWKQVDNTTRRGRGVLGGRTSSPVQEDIIGFITIATRGNEQNFGDLTEVTQYPANGATSSSIRGLTMGGSGPAYKDVISYITIASEGNAIDFGNLTDARHYGAGMSSSTRAIVAGGYDGSGEVNVIDYVEIATLGNAVDFGDTNVARRNNSGCASPTRGVFAGGLTPSSLSDIQFITIASKGNSTKFGDLTQKRQGTGGGSNSIRGLFAGGSSPFTNTIEYVTIQSEGNASDFGDLTQNKRYLPVPTSSTRAVFAGGYESPNKINIIDSVEIATTGNAVDFGDMMMHTNGASTMSDSHGGLGGF